MTAQNLPITCSEPIERAEKYYAILSILGNLKLTQKQIELLAFTAIRGTITPPSAKQEFVKRYKGSEDSLNNLKSQLTRKSFLVKENGQHRVNPKILTDFTDTLILKISMNGQDKGDVNQQSGDPAG